jgi:disulfide bond formation protein DsbB
MPLISVSSANADTAIDRPAPAPDDRLMDVQAVILFFGVAALIGILVLIWFGLMYVAAHFSHAIDESYENVRLRLTPMALTAAWGVATLAMAGSLYFSESAHYTPCTLCWYQRIAMYPLVLILGIAAVRRDIAIRLYAIPLALVGVAISTYHYLLEWFPSIDTGACTVGIPCTQVWFREFGFISLPLLALVAFLLVTVLLLIPLRHPDDETDEAEDET